MKKAKVIGWIESFVITVLFILASMFLHDPLALRASFPWVWFAPVLVALRYGLGPTLLSLFLLFSCYLYYFSIELISIPAQLSILGGFLFSLICMIFHGRWSNRITKAEIISSYLEQRVQSTAHAYKVILFSFQRLEHSLISSPVTLRSSLEELRELQGRSNSKVDLKILNRFLNIVAFHCAIEVAGIFKVEKSVVQPKVLCSVGNISLKPDDFLIQESLEKRAMAYVSTSEILKGHLSEYLIVAPLIDQESKIYAVLIVKELPFLKLSNENLDVISFLITYFCDGIAVKEASKILEKYPDCNIDFANELQRLSNLQKETKLDSAIAIFNFPPTPHQEAYLFKVKQEKRGIDTIWEHRDEDSTISLFILMPLTNLFGLESYKTRISGILEREFALKLNGKEILYKAGLTSFFDNPLNFIEDLLRTK